MLRKVMRYYFLIGITLVNGLIWWIVLRVPLAPPAWRRDIERMAPDQWRNLLLLAIGGTVAVVYFWFSSLSSWGIEDKRNDKS